MINERAILKADNVINLNRILYGKASDLYEIDDPFAQALATRMEKNANLMRTDLIEVFKNYKQTSLNESVSKNGLRK